MFHGQLRPSVGVIIASLLILSLCVQRHPSGTRARRRPLQVASFFNT